MRILADDDGDEDEDDNDNTVKQTPVVRPGAKPGYRPGKAEEGNEEPSAPLEPLAGILDGVLGSDGLLGSNGLLGSDGPLGGLISPISGLLNQTILANLLGKCT